MSDERDQLGELLHQKITDRLPALPTKRVIGEYVDAAISTAIKAGYRKPRKVTTIEELDALPEGSVVMGPWATYQLVLGDWATLGGPGSATVELPATVLHVGGAE